MRYVLLFGHFSFYIFQDRVSVHLDQDSMRTDFFLCLRALKPMISEGNAKYIGMNILNDTFKTGLSSKNVKVGCKPLEQHLAILSVYTFFF